MQIQVHYQGLSNTPWMDEFISGRVEKLNRYLHAAATIQVHLKMENQKYISTLSIFNRGNNYAFSGQGENLYESFQNAIMKASRVLGEEKRKLKNAIHRRNLERRYALRDAA
jgi:ribosomal subunit interface protein